MTLESVHLKTVDDSAQYRYRNRTLEFKFSGVPANSPSWFETPTRAATSYEFNQKKKVPTDVVFTNPVSVSVQRLPAKNVGEFLSKNEFAARVYNKIRTAETQHMQYSPLRIHIVQPTTAPRRDPETKVREESAVDLLRGNNTKRETFIRMLFNLQLRLGLGQIALPYLGLDQQTYLKTARQFTNDCRAENREPVITLDLDYGNRLQFDTLIRSLVRECQVRLFAFPYKSWRHHIASYDVLEGYAEEDVAFLTFDVPRIDPAHFEISTMHYLSFMGSDIYSVLAPRKPSDASINLKGDHPEVEVLPKLGRSSLRFFNPQNLVVEKANGKILDGSKILDEMDASGNQRLLEMLGDFGAVDYDPEKLGRFRMLSKVHELKASSKEMGEFRKRIDEGDTSGYVKEKKVLSTSLDETVGRTRQSRL